MTRDEVARGDPERGSNVEIVTRWRDRQGVKAMAPIELAALGNVLWDAADYERERALKSKPPEKSPEVAPSEAEEVRAERDFAQAAARQYFSTLESVAAERDDLKRRLAQEHAESTARIEGLEAERDHYRQAAANLRALHDSAARGMEELAGKLEAAEARIEEESGNYLRLLEQRDREFVESNAELARLRERIKALEWERDGAKMKGEP